ncbi:MAG: hypothetical protein M3Q42_12885 [Pseudomonadota bacterium]|nr:hypothetical protein [Pseudomonadota bacterium]
MDGTEPMLMMQVAATLFALAALGGVAMAFIRFAGAKRNPSMGLAMAHGLLAAAGVTLLAYAALTMGLPFYALVSLLLFLLGAVLGVMLNLVYHANHRPLPTGLVVVHALIAVVAFALLLVGIFG